jgi:CheY-like chemotaxis protein
MDRITSGPCDLPGTAASVGSVASAPASSRILLLDDSLFTRTMLAAELRELGFVVDAAGSLAQAHAALAANAPDIAIIDVFLEDGPSGLEVARSLRSNPATALTFIIALSGHYAPDSLRLAHEAGCDRFLVKPCPIDVLIETIEHFLGGVRPSAAAS